MRVANSSALSSFCVIGSISSFVALKPTSHCLLHVTWRTVSEIDFVMKRFDSRIDIDSVCFSSAFNSSSLLTQHYAEKTNIDHKFVFKSGITFSLKSGEGCDSVW